MIIVSLSYCIQWAYDLKFYQVIGPDWLIQDRYNIAANKEQLSTRTIPVYELVVRKNAAKLQRLGRD